MSSTLSSPTASTYSGSFFGSTAKNRPPANAYIKSHKSVSFSYAGDNTSFQQGILGDSDSYLVGTLHLNYGKQYQVRDITLNLKGTEKTTWYRAQARTKALYTGGLMSSSTQIVEIECPLKRTLTSDNSNNALYKLRGESKSGVDYSFNLPANKSFNLGTYVTIPIRMRFLRPGVSVERIEVALKSCMDFRCSNPNETRHVKENVVSLVIPRQEIRTQNMDGEYAHTINLFIPRSIQPTYSGRFISITHQFCVKFCLWGANEDFQVEESVRVANIQEKSNNDQEKPIQRHIPSPEQPSPQLIPQHLNRPQHQPTAMVIPSSDVYPTYAEGYYPAYDPDEVGTAVYLDYQNDYNYKLNLHNPPQTHTIEATPYVHNTNNAKEGLDGYGELYPQGFALNSNDLWYRQQLAAIHHQQQLYNKKSQSPVPVIRPAPPPTSHSRHTSNASHLNATNMNDSVLPPSPSISPSRFNANNNSSKLPPYATPEQVYVQHSPKMGENHLTQQQKMNLANRRENRLEINTTLTPRESSPPSYKERLTPTPEDVYTSNYV
ncbi:10281_t:CDS:2 [Cetraspora pellucida]|uniref:10281_t:CDS:1 n=1 Tax=Cetraspora pellucida TaxID=1433469 RepID=A0A9N9B172_9GLOM|nr:10281_t:CDS:2 [Cetraspora pellucida]